MERFFDKLDCVVVTSRCARVRVRYANVCVWHEGEMRSLILSQREAHPGALARARIFLNAF